MTTPKPVRGPLYVEATPITVTLDISPLVSNNVHDLLDLLRSDEFIDTFMELDTTGGLAFEELHAALVERLATKVALTGKQAVRIGEQLVVLGEERSIPEQRGEAA
ncbi:hypothetical protein ACGFYY_38285 [Streptomyces sp. NPDC048331]|uniref:hypothetical protein n=1 Tax=Streptomyces sp. NPDC048331 TaxID=3365534 RepID=UPI003711EF67